MTRITMQTIVYLTHMTNLTNRSTKKKTVYSFFIHKFIPKYHFENPTYSQFNNLITKVMCLTCVFDSEILVNTVIVIICIFDLVDWIDSMLIATFHDEAFLYQHFSSILLLLFCYRLEISWINRFGVAFLINKYFAVPFMWNWTQESYEKEQINFRLFTRALYEIQVEFATCDISKIRIWVVQLQQNSISNLSHSTIQ